MNYSLDASAIIALLDAEPGAEVVEDVLTEPGSVCYAHIFNLAEIYYIYFRRGGQVLAESVLQDLLALRIIFVSSFETTMMKRFGKKRHPSKVAMLCRCPIPSV